MKTSTLLLALFLGLPVLSPAQIFVGSGGLPAPLTFGSAPALLAVEWASSTTGIPGDGSTYTTAGDVSNAVQNLTQSSVVRTLERITADSTFEAARHNTAAGYVITQPTTVGIGLLKATLRNTSSQAFSHINVSYNFGFIGAPGLESAPGHQVFFSTNGLPGSWRFIPAFSSLSNAAPVNASIFLGQWLPNTDIYLLWADDNAPTSSEPGHTIDNFSVGGTVVTNVSLPLSITLTAPAHGTLAFTPVTVNATAAGSLAVTGVSFYTNGVLAATDNSAPYSVVLSQFTTGTNTIYARAFNATGSVYSATNTVRVRPEFVEYGSGEYLQSFDGMGPAGTETPPGWYAGITLPATTIDVTPGDGSSLPQIDVAGWNHGSTGGTDRALGTSPTAGERNMVLRLRNNSGSPLTSFTLRYDGEVWRNYTNATSGWLTNYYSTNLGATWIPTTFHFQQPFPSVPVPPQGPVDGNLPGNRTASIGGTIFPAALIQTGAVIYFRWHDFNESGTDGALAVDNVRFTGIPLAANDTCAGATFLYNGFSESVDTRNATITGDATPVCGFNMDQGVWYRFTPSVNGRVVFSASASFSTRIGAYVNGCANYLDCGSGSVTINYSAAPFATYYFFVAGTLGNVGNINVSATVCDKPNSITVAVDSIQNVSDGIRVTYRADYFGNIGTSFVWSFDGSEQATTFNRYFSHDFGLFENYPNIVSVRIFNSCGDGLGGTPVNPPCGAICLSAGFTGTHNTTDGGSDAYDLTTACGYLDPGITKWLRLGIDTNSAGLAFLSTSNNSTSTDTIIGVYRGSIADSSLLREVACLNNSGNNGFVRFETRPGTNYYLAVRTLNPGALKITHGYELIPPTPANDLCANAIVMTAGVTYSNNTLNAGTDAQTLACAGAFGRGVWYSFRTNIAGPVILSTCGSGFDTALQVYTGTCGSVLTAVANTCANNNGPVCPGDKASLVFNAAANVTYLILAGGATQAAGGLVISATLCQAPGFSNLTSFATNEVNGVRVTYQAAFTNNTPHSYRWSFSDGVVTNSSASVISRLYGPFTPYPASVTVSATNLCGSSSFVFPLAPPCAPLCLAFVVGTSLTHTDALGSGTNGTSYGVAFPSSGTRWFRLTTLTNAAGFAVIDSAGTPYDTRLAVYRGPFSPSNALVNIASNDNFGGALQSRVEFETRPGTNYWLAVNATNGGPLILNYGYPLRFESLVLTNVGPNRALDIRTQPLPSFQYRLRGSNNLAQHPSNWTVLVTTNFSSSVSANTNILRYRDTNVPLLNQRFYRIERVGP